MKLRRFQKSDLEAARYLHESVMRAADAFHSGPWDSDLDDIEGVYLSAGGEFLVGEVDGQIVGMGALRRVDRVTAEIKRMRVLPAHQGKGYGKAILTALERRAKELGYSMLVLDTGPQLTAARGLYESFGYRRTGTRGERGFTELLYEKRLTEESPSR
jgi:ribosomal protein S18 acetylase RimI-like enzyme